MHFTNFDFLDVQHFRMKQFFRSPSLFSVMQSDIEETLKRIQGQKGVVGVIVSNSEGETSNMVDHVFIISDIASNDILDV